MTDDVRQRFLGAERRPRRHPRTLCHLPARLELRSFDRTQRTVYELVWRMPIRREIPRMRLTSFSDYGLRMLMRLASAPGTPFSTADLAREFGLSRHHLTKIIQHLARGGIVETRRGGAFLCKDPADVRIGDVIQLLEEGQALVECLSPIGGDCTIDGRCRLKARLRHAEARFVEDLNRSTLKEIALPFGEAV